MPTTMHMPSVAVTIDPAEDVMVVSHDFVKAAFHAAKQINEFRSYVDLGYIRVEPITNVELVLGMESSVAAKLSKEALEREMAGWEALSQEAISKSESAP